MGKGRQTMNATTDPFEFGIPTASVFPSTASRIAKRFDDNGQNWTDEDGVDLGDACKSESATITTRDDLYRYTFEDGSALVEGPGGWDLALDPSEPNCFCFEGAGPEHYHECPRRLGAINGRCSTNDPLAEWTHWPSGPAEKAIAR